MKCSKRVKQNIVLAYNTIGDGTFSRVDVMEITKLSDTSSGDLLKRMRDNNLIEPVSGHGKGKYKFL